MALERFYLAQILKPGDTLSLEKEEHHHISHVLRVQENEEISLVNGSGYLAQAKILQVKKNQTVVQIKSIHQFEKQTKPISLAIALMRLSKLEWIIEKATEIGVDEILIYPAKYSKQKNISAHQIQRLETIMISAMKQSHRVFLPKLIILQDLQTVLQKENTIIYGDPEGTFLKKESIQYPILFITGPESGFSEEEYYLMGKKAHAAKISPNILRAETAPLVALSLLTFFR